MVDFYEHALGVKLDEATKAQMHKEWLESQACFDALRNSMVGAARNLPEEIAEAVKNAGQKPPRKDKGKPHRKRKTISGAWRSAADVANDFNRAFKPCMIEQGVPKIGNCNEAKINQWDAKHPDAEHKNRWGYHARLRIDANLKPEYWNVVAGWGEYWSDYKAQFVKWRKTHKNSPRSYFRFNPMTRTDIDPERIGVDAGGKKYVRSMSDDEIRAGGK